ncbi:MAG: thymidine phosphorylase [Clostridia bacterium]|nr:thymidine phosphorylase [Clostridia bacterium]
MRIYDIISDKRDNKELTDEQIRFFVKGYTRGEIEHYHASALLMAIYLNGMTDRETVTLTKEMAESGDMLDLSAIDGITVDKHSTGGVGDKTTLIVAPIVASVGLKTAKMSGRGLGHTGGTIDKLESIDGFCTSLSPEIFIDKVKKHGICVVGQSGDLAPADKKIYALRDATATVGSMPLIASSIMSKKLAAGASCIVLDVKTGSGAFMKTPEDAEALSEKMVNIGKSAGRKVAAVISDMDTPLGKNIGNSLEVIEAVEVLKNGESSDLREVSLVLAGNIIALAEGISADEGIKKATAQLESGAAYEKFREFISAQGGDLRQIDDPSLFKQPLYSSDVLCAEDGFIGSMNAEMIGSASVILGAGRVKKDDPIDHSAGIILHRKTGDRVLKGEKIATLYTDSKESFDSAEKLIRQSITVTSEKIERPPLIYKVIY